MVNVKCAHSRCVVALIEMHGYPLHMYPISAYELTIKSKLVHTFNFSSIPLKPLEDDECMLTDCTSSNNDR